jgi:ankyrin repeat protein
LAKLLPFADVNEHNGTTPLIQACSTGKSIEVVRTLLDAGATRSINAQDLAGGSALFFVELLISRGADVSLTVPDAGKDGHRYPPGWTPLFAALATGVGCHEKKLKMLWMQVLLSMPSICGGIVSLQ